MQIENEVRFNTLDDSDSNTSSSKASLGSESYTEIGFTCLDMIDKEEYRKLDLQKESISLYQIQMTQQKWNR